jgi:light-regulated signal transduction histidine kinase (bacteriophytochrome)
MVRSETDQLKSRAAESNKRGLSAYSTLIASTFLEIALICVIAFLISRGLDVRLRTQQALQTERDLLDRRVTERTKELDFANRELTRSNRELQDFAFVASHDLQEPLRKIQAFGDRLMTSFTKELSEEGLDYLSRMNSAAQRMQRLIKELLEFSRLATMTRPFEPVDLNDIVTNVVSDLEMSIQDTNGRVDVEELPVIEGDRLQMQQLFQNLIGNSLKFHRPDAPPIVTISSAKESGIVRLIVQDNGIGFDERFIDKIFIPFQRLHSRSEYEGTGIGLAMCRRIVERHGGSISARSRPDEGSAFIVELPDKTSENGDRRDVHEQKSDDSDGR